MCEPAQTMQTVLQRVT